MTVLSVKVPFRTKPIIVQSLKEASAAFCKVRDDEDLGARDLGVKDGNIYEDGKKIGNVSYNGRLWDNNHVELIP